MCEWRVGRDAAMDAAEALWTTLYRHLNNAPGDGTEGIGREIRSLAWGSHPAWKATETALREVLVALLTDAGLPMPIERAARVRDLASDSGEGIEYALAWHLANDRPDDYGIHVDRCAYGCDAVVPGPGALCADCAYCLVADQINGVAAS